MSEAVKTRHIRRAPHAAGNLFYFKKTTPRKVLSEIRTKYAPYLAPDPDDEPVDITTTAWYKELDESMTPGEYLKHLREGLGLTQKGIGEQVGTNAAHVSDYETGRRSISKDMAKRLAVLFKVSTDVFI